MYAANAANVYDNGQRLCLYILSNMVSLVSICRAYQKITTTSHIRQASAHAKRAVYQSHAVINGCVMR